jgi:hypothetical protein
MTCVFLLLVVLFCYGNVSAQTPQKPFSISPLPAPDCIYLGQAVKVIEKKRQWHVPLTAQDAEEERLWQTACSAYHPSPDEELCRQLAEWVGGFAQMRTQGMRLQEALGILRQSMAAAPVEAPALMERLKTLMTTAVTDIYASPLLPPRQVEDRFEAQCLTTKPTAQGHGR